MEHQDSQSSQKSGASTSIRTASLQHQQFGSRLMQLPQELRLEIYSYLFSSTPLVIRDPHIHALQKQRLPPGSPNALAILRTCRRMSADIDDSWLKQSYFHFEDPVLLLNKLAAIPVTLRSQIRHVKLLGAYVWCYYGSGIEHKIETIDLCQVLQLLPGLNLDTLTVLGNEMSWVTYQTLHRLTRFSNGWQELRFALDDLQFRSLRSQGDEGVLKNMQDALKERQGSGSDGSVVMYHCIDTASQHIILKPLEHGSVFGESVHGQTLATFGVHRTPDVSQGKRFPGPGGEFAVVKRGTGAVYSVGELSPCADFDFRCVHNLLGKECMTADETLRFLDDEQKCGKLWMKKESSVLVRGQETPFSVWFDHYYSVDPLPMHPGTVFSW